MTEATTLISACAVNDRIEIKVDERISDLTKRIKFPEKKTFFGKKIDKLRYGENPHQKSSIYFSSLKDDQSNLQKLSGKDLSYNNYNDIFAALDILFTDKKLPLTVIIKHTNPCGVACNKSPLQSFINAQASDPISSFGGIVACNFKINNKVAFKIKDPLFGFNDAKRRNFP